MNNSQYFFFITAILSLASCTDKSTTTEVHDNFNSPVTANVTNSFTYTVNANQYSENSQNNLSFLSDSLIVTLSSSNYLSGQAIISVRDSQNTPIFLDTVKSNKTIAIANLKTTKPKHCDIIINNFAAKLVFVLVGQ